MSAATRQDASPSILSALTPEQATAARATGPVLVLAGAGSGKTRSLVAGIAARIVERGIPAARILAVTFTNKAAGEMRDRIRSSLGVDAPSWLGTFHALGARMLRMEPDIAGLRPGFDVLDAGDTQRILRRLLKEATRVAGDEEAGDRKLLKTIGDRISRMKDQLVTDALASAHVEAFITECRSRRRPCDEPGWRLTLRVYRLYQLELRTLNAADFGDLVMWPALALRGDESFRRRWSERFDCVLTDEFQDVNHAQFTWLRELSRAHGELFAVGDDAQSIFSWRGADIGYIRRFQSDFSGATVVRLEENFRSTGKILDAANAVIAHDCSRLEKRLFTRLGDGLPVEVVATDNGDAEAVAIAQEIGRRAAEGVPYDEMAILYRANRLSRAIEEKLLAARIPYTIVGDTGFYQRQPVKDGLALLRLAACPEDQQADEAFRRVANKPARGLGAKALGMIEIEAGWRGISLLEATATAALPKTTAARLAEFRRVLEEAGRHQGSLGERLRFLLQATGYSQMLRAGDVDDAEAAEENLAELAMLADDFGTVTDLLEHAALAAAGPREETTGRVQLLTLHKAKGLEWPHVFLAGWNASIFPSPNAEDVEEELRLAYVALTRGMRRVSVCWSRFRDGRQDFASPFVGFLPTASHVQGWHRYQMQRSDTRRGQWSKQQKQLDALGLLS